MHNIVPWLDKERGLSKINIQYPVNGPHIKPTEFSTVVFEIEAIKNETDAESKILADGPGPRTHIMGTADTPLDCYVEAFLLEMLRGEQSACKIQSEDNDLTIEFTINLIQFDNARQVHRIPLNVAFDVLKKYKEIGVTMFKFNPKFAHHYFSKAYKIISSFATEGYEEIGSLEVFALKHTIQNNIAACLIIEKRYEEAISMLDFVDDPGNDKNDLLFQKAVFRKAQALYNLKKYEDVVQCLNGVDYKTNSSMKVLYTATQEQLKREKEQFTDMAKKMFGN